MHHMVPMNKARCVLMTLTKPRYVGLAIEPQELLAETLIPQAIHLSVVIEVLGQIRQAEMTPMLQRMYQSEGGSELCDTLMKYLYKGMAQGPSNHPSKSVTSQATGFSQAGGRSFGGAESGGQHMSVLLSWHEKVSGSFPYVKKKLHGR